MKYSDIYELQVAQTVKEIVEFNQDEYLDFDRDLDLLLGKYDKELKYLLGE